MHSLFPAFAALAVAGAEAAAAAAPPTTGAFVNAQGITEIFGNSFGRPGYDETYDYIVIGGGNAGNTIAARLAQANFSVAVVEAGGFYEELDGNRTQVPGYNYLNTLEFPIGEVSTLTQIGLNTTPQAGYANREIFYIASETFGGGSAANYMGFQRGTVGTFDSWAKQTGDDFWTWENVYPAYKKSVNFSEPDTTKIPASYNITWDPDAYISNGGPLQISYGNYFGPSGPYINAAFAASGFEKLNGLSSGKLIGYGTMTAAIDIRTATRETSETSFLQMAARETDIKIYPNALVSRITFDSQKTANGVDVQANSAAASLNYHLSATKEVILSAGTWHSPQILMLSGIGPAETLQQYDIPVIADVPGVGQNEWDQGVVSMVLKVNVSTNTQFQAGSPDVVADVIEEYLDHQSGILSGVGAGLSFGYEKIPSWLHSAYSKEALEFLDTFPSDWPEVEVLYLENIPLAALEAITGAPPGPDDNYLAIAGVLTTTASQGNMTIVSNSILDQPVISPNWLSDPDGIDKQQAYAVFQRLREIHGNLSIVEEEFYPGPNVTSEADINTYLAETMSHLFHASRTCKMGPASDPLAVVDSRARVRGVSNLRVVDLSSVPSMPPGQPMASVYMFAEKIAESILQGQ